MSIPLEITASDACLLLGNTPHVRLIDCRDRDEWEITRLPGAQLIPLAQLSNEARTQLTDLNQRILIYCHYGDRSVRAAQWLRDLGYTKAQSIAGGIDAWTVENDHTLPRY